MPSLIYRQFLVYIGIGILTACIDIGAMQALLVAGVGHPGAVSVGFILGLIFNYFSHQRVTFKAQNSRRSVVRFGVLVVLNYLLTMLCVELSVITVDNVLAGKLVSLPLVAMNGFLLGRYWVFKKHSLPAP
jgi:putative flippase GtrA